MARPSSGHERAATLAHTVLVPPPVRVSVYVVGPGPFGSTAGHDTVTARVDESAESTALKFGAGGCHLLQVAQRNIAYTEETGAAGIALLAHRLPDFGVSISPVVVGRGPVQHVAVDVIGREMVERTGHRLHDLSREWRSGIVGQAVVLTGLIGKFCLQKNVVTRDYARAIGGG